MRLFGVKPRGRIGPRMMWLETALHVSGTYRRVSLKALKEGSRASRAFILEALGNHIMVLSKGLTLGSGLRGESFWRMALTGRRLRAGEAVRRLLSLSRQRRWTGAVVGMGRGESPGESQHLMNSRELGAWAKQPPSPVREMKEKSDKRVQKRILKGVSDQGVQCSWGVWGAPDWEVSRAASHRVWSPGQRHRQRLGAGWRCRVMIHTGCRWPWRIIFIQMVGTEPLSRWIWMWLYDEKELG